MKLSPIYWIFSSVVVLAGVGMMIAGAAMYDEQIEDDENSVMETFADFRNLELEVEYCTLTLKSSESAQECIVEFIGAHSTPKMYLDGDTLVVEQKQKMPLQVISFGKWQKCGEVIITVPERDYDQMHISLGMTDGNTIDSISCKDMELDCGVGDIELQDIHIAGEFDVDGGTGDMFLTDVSVDGECTMDLGVGTLEAENLVVKGKSDFDFGTGDCTISDSRIGKLELDCGVGDVKILSTELLGDAEIQQGTGDVEMNISGSSDAYSVLTESGAGDVTIDGDNINTLKNKDSEYTINIDCGVGDVDIRFFDET